MTQIQVNKIFGLVLLDMLVVRGEVSDEAKLSGLNLSTIRDGKTSSGTKPMSSVEVEVDKLVLLYLLRVVWHVNIGVGDCHKLYYISLVSG